MLTRTAAMIGLLTLSLAGCTKPQPVADTPAACAVATARVTAQRGLPASHVAVCDPITDANSPPGYYVLALHAHCQEAVCGSTLMGWFAVRKTTGEVLEWDVAELKVGPALAKR